MINIIWSEINLSLGFDVFLKKIPKPLQRNILRYKRNEDRWARMIGRLLVIKGMEKHGFPSLDLTKILYDGNNRPYLLGLPDFNISHSGKYVICAFSTNKVGIDIEEIKAINFSYYREIFSSKEWEDILTSQNILERFFHNWTAKESLIKADGRGLLLPLKEIELKEGSGNVIKENWFLKKIVINNKCIGHLAFKDDKTDIVIEEINVLELV